METVVRQPGEAQPVMGHFAAVKIASDETDERFCVLETTLAAGGGFTSRLHRHRSYVESWFVADGTLEFCSGNETLLAPAGSFVLAPPSAPHTFGNSGPEETRIVAFYTPGGMDRFIAELGKLRSMDDPGFKAFATLFDRYDTEPADPNVPADIPVRVTAPDKAERLSVGGGTITILADSAATGGSFALVDYTAPPGFPGPPPHRHREIVDVFYVLEGELTLEVEGKTIAAQPGTLAAVAPGTVHKFSNPSDRPARFLGFVSPGGFEQYFRDVAAAIGDGPFDPAVAAPLIAKYDYEAA
jgi:quercetin dioxygenase-like cupin family protein